MGASEPAADAAPAGGAGRRRLDEPRLGFCDDFGRLYARHGLSIGFGRVFGLLLISDEPVGLDDIAGALGVSRTGAHVAARELETAGVARRLAVPGRRRIFYEANDDMDPIFAGQLSRTRQS